MQTLLGFILIQLAVLESVVAPQQLTIDIDKQIPIKANTRIVLSDSPTLEQRTELSSLLKELPFSPLISSAEESDSGGFAIRIGIVGEHPHFETRTFRRRVRDVKELGPEGYLLWIDKDRGVLLAGNTDQGVHHGIETLAVIASEFGTQWPELEIRDTPSLEIRAALLESIPTEKDLDALSAAHCNMVIFSHPDFQWLEADAARTWRDVFREARSRHMEPVPSFSIFHDAEKLIAKAPLAAEGRTTEEMLVLQGTRDSLLSNPFPLIGPRGAQPEVSIGSIHFKENEDYRLISLTDDILPLWGIRRTRDSGIPDGATVSVRYAYTTNETSALCPDSLETHAVVDAALKRLTEALAPKYLFAGPGPITRLNEDPRCQNTHESDAERIAAGLALVYAKARDYAPDICLIVEEDTEFSGDIPVIWPEDVDLPAGTLRITSQAQSGTIVAASSPAEAYFLTRSAVERNGRGILVCEASEIADIATALGRGWNPQVPEFAWPEGLNTYFNASLWRPDFETRLVTLANYINKETRKGRSLKELLRTFNEVYDSLRKTLDEDPELELTRTQYEILLDYLELEAAYTEDPRRVPPGKVVNLVERQAALDLRIDTERKERIIDTIEGQGLFVPASILFGVALDYQRNTPIPRTGNILLPIPVRPEFTYLPNETTATMDLRGFPQTIMRINFESVRPEEFRLSFQSSPTMQVIKPTTGAELRSPILPEQLTGPGMLALTVLSPAQSTILREIEVIAEKKAAILRCPERITPANEFKRSDWPTTAEASGFVLLSGDSFAVAPTLVRTAHTRRALYFYIQAYEPRIHALSANHTRRDSPLWEDESVEILLLAPEKAPIRLLVNPLGTLYDARRGDSGWDGPWEVECTKNIDSWSALVSIPFDALEASPDGTWKVDFLRHRRNALSEDSKWSPREKNRYGILEFR